MLNISKIVLMVFAIVTCFALLFGAKIQIDNRNARITLLHQEQLSNEVKRLAKNTIKPVNMEHVRCMATNIYHEAAGEPFMGQVAVARVVMNRVKHGFASNPCAVIYQSVVVQDSESDATRKICQFSWVCQGKSTPAKNSKYLQAEDIAKKVLVENKWKEVVPGNTFFFHNTSVNPEWKYTRVAEIGNHIFYSKDKQRN